MEWTDIANLEEQRAFVIDEYIDAALDIPDCLLGEWPVLMLPSEQVRVEDRRDALRDIIRATTAIQNALIALWLETDEPVPLDVRLCDDASA